jgi:hypothetical protein
MLRLHTVKQYCRNSKWRGVTQAPLDGRSTTSVRRVGAKLYQANWCIGCQIDGTECFQHTRSYGIWTQTLTLCQLPGWVLTVQQLEVGGDALMTPQELECLLDAVGGRRWASWPGGASREIWPGSWGKVVRKDRKWWLVEAEWMRIIWLGRERSWCTGLGFGQSWTKWVSNCCGVCLHVAHLLRIVPHCLEISGSHSAAGDSRSSFPSLNLINLETSQLCAHLVNHV